jgi:hypothetical protein
LRGRSTERKTCALIVHKPQYDGLWDGETSEIEPPILGRAPLARYIARRFATSYNDRQACREDKKQRPDGNRRQLRSSHCRKSFLVSAISLIMTGSQPVANRMTRSGATLKNRGIDSGDSLSSRKTPTNNRDIKLLAKGHRGSGRIAPNRNGQTSILISPSNRLLSRCRQGLVSTW